MSDFEIKDRYDIEDLLEVMRVLRSPEGCPWDRAQTHESIRKNFIEETYEAVEAIDKDDKALLKEELGDVLMQVVFHCQMEAENGNFEFSDIVSDVTKKLVVRHPHIFGDEKANTPEDVAKIWENVKLKTKHQKKGSEPMLSVPLQFPALMRAQKVQKRAQTAGFYNDDVSEAISQLKNEISVLEQAVNNKDDENIREKMGDVLFASTNVSRFLNCDAEEVLTQSTNKFINRFIKMEEILKKDGRNLDDAENSELLEIWEKVLKDENR